ncbi:MAG TPA: hypothetical protein VF478_06240 [Anaerolineae bacterium]
MTAILDELKMYTRFAQGLEDFLRHPITLQQAKSLIHQQIEQREDNFLRLVEKGIFGYPRSPYLPLLKLAHCELGDIENIVRTHGLESALHALRAAGVYFTFEEFKGRAPVIRSGHAISVQARDFDNPFVRHYYEGRSGGSTGAGTRIATDLDHLADQTPNELVSNVAHDVHGVPTAIWFGAFPDGTGFNIAFRFARAGSKIDRWFSPIAIKDRPPAMKYRLANQFILSMARLAGATIPSPEPLPLDRAVVIARWAAEQLRAHQVPFVSTTVSLAVRVSTAAQQAGLNLTGAVLMGGGEPPTPAKVREISRCGARWIPNYFLSEAGIVGWGCARPVDGNDIHFFKNTLALIQSPRQITHADISVDAFYLTTLLPTSPKLMLNVESDDYGLVEQRACGCLLEQCGFTEHIRHIRSFTKLTGEGVTLVGSEMVRILEEVLPARFGGSHLDYQLLEEENDESLTQLSLLVSPRIEIADEAAVIDTVLHALEKSSVAADVAGIIWSQAKTLRVKRMEPVWTSRGKLMPLHLARNSRQKPEAPSSRWNQ